MKRRKAKTLTGIATVNGRKRAGAAWLLAGCLALSASAHADKVVLKNGQSLEGRVLEETDAAIKFQDMGRMVLILKRDQIQSIDKGENPLILEEQGDEAFKKKEYEQALDFFTRALKLGAQQKRVESKIAEVQRLMEERDLGPWAQDVKDIRGLLESGRLDQAEQKTNELVEAMPADSPMRDLAIELQSDVHFRRALELIDSIDNVSAEKELRKSLEINPFNFDACLQLARLSAQVSSRRTEAVALYERVLTDGEKTLTKDRKLAIMDEVAKLYVQQDNQERAADYYGRIYAENPDQRQGLGNDYVTALRRVADKVDKESPEKAVECLDKAIAIQPYDADLRAELANNLLASKNYDRCIIEFRKLLETKSDYRHANHNLAKAYIATGDLADARTSLRREIELESGNYDAIVDLGDILVQMGDFDQAKAYYQQARQLAPDQIRATVALASSERVLGNYPEARRYLSELLEKAPDDIGTNLEMGLLAKDEKKYDESTRNLDHVIELIETDKNEETKEANKKKLADAMLARGEVKLLTKGPSTATEDFNRALKVYPDYPAAYFNMGAAYEKKYNASKEMEDLKKAEESMLKARELAPENPEFAFGLGVLYHQVLASADSAHQDEYFKKALDNYRAYIDKGGAEVAKVQAWISELSAGM